MRRFAVILLLLALSLPAPLRAQEPPPLVESIEVTIVNVDVVVTDRKGQRVGGLTRDDFEVFESGIPQPITNFFEVSTSQTSTAGSRAEAVGAESPVAVEPERRRSFVIFLDDDTLTPFSRRDVIRSMITFLESEMRPGDGAAVFTWGKSLKMEAPFTSDREEVIAALRRIEKSLPFGLLDGGSKVQMRQRLLDIVENGRGGGGGGRASKGALNTFDDALREVRLYAEEVSSNLRRKSAVMRGTMAALAGLEGRKVFVFVTESLPQQPGFEAFELLESLKGVMGEPNKSVLGYANAYNSTREIEAIAEAANANGFVLYPIHARRPEHSTLSSEYDLKEATGEAVAAVLRAANIELANETVTVNALAAATGGQALVGTRNFDLAFSRISEDLAAYYSLGYRADSAGVDRTRSIQVKVKKNGRYHVRARRSLLKKSHEAAMRDIVVAHLFHLGRANDLGASVTGGNPKVAVDGNVEVPLAVTVPMSSLTLVPDGNDLRGELSIFAAFMRDDGAVSEIARERQQFRFPADSLRRRKEVTLNLDVTADDRTDRISIGVVDGVSGATGYAVWSFPPVRSEESETSDVSRRIAGE